MTPPPRAAGRLSAATLVALALACAPVRADDPELPGPPLLDGDKIDAINRDGLVRAIVTSGAAPSTAPYVALALLHAGAHDRVALWSFEGPLSNIFSRRALGASALVLNAAHALPPGPLAVAANHLATLHAGAYVGCWQWHNPDYLRPFHRDELRVIADGNPVPIGIDETAVYARAIIRAHRASPRAFARAARRDVTYAHVTGDPNLYRGNVLHIAGRLKRINRFQPMHEVGLAGVNDLYEAWVFPEYLGAQPFCVVFTQWPKGLSRDLLGKPTIDAAIRVSCDGFFFKTFRYTANDGRGGQRAAPLLVGHTIAVLAAPTLGSSSNRPAHLMLIGISGAVSALIVGVFVVTFWYRRSDNRVRRRLLAAYAGEFVPPAPDAVPVAAPVASGGKRPANGAGRLPFPPRITFPAGRGDRGDGPEGGGEKPPEDASGA